MKKLNIVQLYIGIILGAIVLSLGINWLLTYGLIWVVNGVFDINLFPKFWYVFWGLVILTTIFNPYKGSSK